MFKRNDIILIVSILLISMIGVFGIRAMEGGYNTKTAVISVDGQEVSRILIDNSSDTKTYNFKFGENIGYLDVKDGAVKMQEMDKIICPEGICSDTGWISKSYESIVCLPNRIIVTIENDEAAHENNNFIDSVSS